MQRKFLEGLQIEGLEGGLPKEVIDSIMNENGKDVETTKTKLNGQIENLQSQLETNEGLLKDANSQIENFKSLDVEGTKKAADEWKTKFEQAAAEQKTKEEAYQKQIRDQQYDFKLNEIAGQHKFVDDIAKEAFVNNLKKQEFKFGEDGTLQGANDYINKFKEEHKGIFVTETPSEPAEPQLPTFSLPTSGQIKTENTNPFGFNFNYLRKPKE